MARQTHAEHHESLGMPPPRSQLPCSCGWGSGRQPGEVFTTKSGKVLTDEDIQRLADEAEAGLLVPPATDWPAFARDHLNPDPEALHRHLPEWLR